jgi:hypothetical protein
MNIDLKGHPPFVVNDVADVFEGGLVRGIVDEDIHSIQFGHSLLNNRTAVARNQNGLASLRQMKLHWRARLLLFDTGRHSRDRHQRLRNLIKQLSGILFFAKGHGKQLDDRRLA